MMWRNLIERDQEQGFRNQGANPEYISYENTAFDNRIRKCDIFQHGILIPIPVTSSQFSKLASLFHFPYITLFRIVPMAPFSNLETWAWEMPKTLATSIWVLPS